jgi:hypothetical protein
MKRGKFITLFGGAAATCSALCQARLVAIA